MLVASAVLAFMVMIGGAIILEQYAKVHEVYVVYQENAEQDRERAAETIAKDCTDREKTELVTCIRDELTTYYRDLANDENLKAQQDMAYWAAAVFFSSTVLTSIGILLLWQTLRATRQTLREAELATKAAQDNVDVAERIGEAQVRSYLYCVSAKYRRQKDSIIAIIELGNAGNTPAGEVTVNGEVTIHDVGGFRSLPRVTRWVGSGLSGAYFQPIIANGKTTDEVQFDWDLDFVTALEIDDDAAFKRQVFDDGNEIWFDLVIRWKDAFDRNHAIPLVLNAIIDVHPMSPNKKRSRTGKLDISIDDTRLGVGNEDEENA